MDAAELRQLSAEDLAAKAKELRAELFGARLKHATGQLEDTARLGALRREVARAETILRQKQGATK
jgi:large subunit ribosomal protein L29